MAGLPEAMACSCRCGVLSTVSASTSAFTRIVFSGNNVHTDLRATPSHFVLNHISHRRTPWDGGQPVGWQCRSLEATDRHVLAQFGDDTAFASTSSPSSSTQFIFSAVVFATKLVNLMKPASLATVGFRSATSTNAPTLPLIAQ